MSEQPREPQPSAPESFRDLLIRRGSEAAARVVNARKLAGMGDGAIDTGLAIRYLRTEPTANDTLSQEVAKSDQPDLNAIITDAEHALVATSPQTPLAEHQAALIDFNKDAGLVRLWRFPGALPPEAISELVTTTEPTQTEPLDGSQLATRIYRAIESAPSVYDQA